MAPHTTRGGSEIPSHGRPGAPHTRASDRTRPTEAPRETAAPAPESTSREPPALLTRPALAAACRLSPIAPRLGGVCHRVFRASACVWSASVGLHRDLSHLCIAAATHTFILGQLVHGDEHLVERPELCLDGPGLLEAIFCAVIVWGVLGELRPAHRPVSHAQRVIRRDGTSGAAPCAQRPCTTPASLNRANGDQGRVHACARGRVCGGHAHKRCAAPLPRPMLHPPRSPWAAPVSSSAATLLSPCSDPWRVACGSQ